MSQLAPPPAPPAVALDGDDRLKRVHFRLWQLLLTALTILITGWFISITHCRGVATASAIAVADGTS